MAASIKYTECEKTLENYWENVKAVDDLPRRYVVSAVAPFFIYEENANKTPADLEQELRERNLNFGLIAKPINDQFRHMVATGSMAIIKMKYIHMYGGEGQPCPSTAPPEHLSEIDLIFSCRERADAHAEMISINGSTEKNLELLETAGVAMPVGTVVRYHGSAEEGFFKGTVSIRAEEITLQDMFESAHAKYPNARLALVSFDTGESSGPIMGLVNGDSLVSNIGVKYHYVDGVQATEFVVIERLPFGQAAEDEEEDN